MSDGYARHVTAKLIDVSTMKGEEMPKPTDEASHQDWYDAGYRDGAKAERDAVALWMSNHGYATGHGDTVEDMLTMLVQGVKGLD